MTFKSKDIRYIHNTQNYMYYSMLLHNTQNYMYYSMLWTKKNLEHRVYGPCVFMHSGYRQWFRNGIFMKDNLKDDF